MPTVCYNPKEDNDKWTLYDLADRLLMKGWQIPVYSLSENLQKMTLIKVCMDLYISSIFLI
ncbi:TPA: hypothetical protein KNH21_002317 [Clostridioides difficile]|uniref:hypothetical protein n=1 Tax=Clostridioides difficile TaxID=1496 RepID=UPI001A1965C1|nr:hypothetical protein [Clostridioides difficile]MBH6949120.1 hypothetical protein [Clostridioides difficile]MCP8382608.1 hypothetical protein [Clostridioides difficile]HBE9109030.1 hypothetical protein [Clostridioides difficile]HBF4994275.1 hypothetical protein [Clostridioides difficile]HBG7747722.1 hypothetical protein [Clostridioides difficile]